MSPSRILTSAISAANQILGSQTGSHRRQTPGDKERRQATISLAIAATPHRPTGLAFGRPAYGPWGCQRGCLSCVRRAGTVSALADQPGLEVPEPIVAAESGHDQVGGTPHGVGVDRAPRGVQVDV